MNKCKNAARAFAEGAEEYAPGPKGPGYVSADDLDKLRAQGISPRLVSNIKLELNRSDFGLLLRFLEERAVRSDNFLEVRQAVLFSEMLREQAKEY